MRERMSPPDLRPRVISVDVRPHPAGGSLLSLPAGKLWRVPPAPGEIESLLRNCDGSTPLSTLCASAADPAAMNELITALLDAGALADGAGCGRADASLILVGDETLCDLVVDSGLVREFRSAVPCSPEHFEEVARASSRDHLVVALDAGLNPDFLTGINDICALLGLRWTQFHLDHGKGWLGPHVDPGRSPDYRDLLGRRLAAAEDAAVQRALLTRAFSAHDGSPAELTWMLSLLFADIAHWVAGRPAQGWWHEVEVNPSDLTVSRHPVLPLPLREGPRSLQPPGSGADLLVDRRTGIITALHEAHRHPSLPDALVTVLSRVSDVSRLYPHVNDRICTGSTFADHEGARAAAMGEALERYCGNLVRKDLLARGSYSSLIARGEHCVDPERLVLFSERQYNTPGFPFVPFTREHETWWVAGRSLSNDRPAFLPASLTYVNWHIGDFSDEQPTNNPFYPGIAAGPNLEAAMTSALQEIVERHATMIWWANAHALPAVIPTSRLEGLWQRGSAQRAWLIHLDNEFGVPVFAGVVEDVENELFNIGFAARSDPEAAAAKAWTEALTLQDVSRDLLDPHGDFRRAAANDEFSDRFVKPWRRDRAYLDDYRPDFRDAGDLMCQQQIFLDPRARDVVRPWTDVPATRSFEDVPSMPDGSLNSYRKVLESRGLEIFYADLSTPDVEATGMRVVRVLVPGLVPNFAAAFPFLGRKAIQEAAVRLGWRVSPLAEEDINLFPLPHA
ncbi:hypothetical protein E1295_08115 [Nonomuraea mesophila]|uniref:YcaO domain-containing protein n=2 Tax=Nonomuraea mesophila TaxID=2530382 RepID=A0A4R5FTZ2_9ACTN|nr:hypothetical protein E1295_08115 [Nonomuraea mesophila]